MSHYIFRRNFALLCLLLLTTGLAAAPRSETVAREVTGSGISRDEAVANALQEAARQIFGVTIEVAQIRQSMSAEAISDSESSYASSDTTTTATAIQTPQGIIRSYQILSHQRNDASQQHEVRLAVEAVRFAGTTGGGSEKRLSLAVIPARVSVQRFPDGDRFRSAADSARQWNQALINQFVQSRKFAVLDREFVRETIAEMNLIASDQVPLTEQIRLGQQLGADFLLVGSLEDCSRSSKNLRIQLTGEQRREDTVRMLFSYRIIDVATREIRSADSFLRQWTSSELHQLAQNRSGSPEQWQSLVFREAAHQVSSEILNIIYPIKVVQAASPQRIILNQGGIRLSIGQQFEIFSRGEVMVDPDTGESLGAEEFLAATVEVTRVNPKFSVARVLSGDAAAIDRGAICRAPANTNNNTASPNNPASQNKKAPPGRFTFPGQN